MKLLDRWRSIEPTIRSEGRLVRLDSAHRTVFIGDTHGDLDATERVIARFGDSETTLIFLGDAVDRGADSRGNLERILQAKSDAPDRVFLLMGNHEGWGAATFSPADFWMSLPSDEERELARGLLSLPLAAWHPAGLLAVHGGLPDLRSVQEIESIVPGSPTWRDVVWGDWTEAWHAAPSRSAIGRPTYGQDVFQHRIEALNLRVVIRSHQPNAPTYLYDDRCLTLFTSSAYGGTIRRVAVWTASTRLRTARDLELVEL
jgi:hypothetical protein